MNQKGFSTIILIGIIAIIVLVIGIAGYFIIVPQLQETPTSEEKTAPIEVQPSEKSTQESIYDILAKAENIGPVQYETVSTATGVTSGVTMTVTMKVWQKTPYMRMDSTTAGTTTKMIVHPDAVYFYDASKDKYLKETAEEMATKFTQKSFAELSKEIRESTTLKELGTKIIDGKLTTIVEYSHSFTAGETPITITQKVWTWNEKGIPLKTESTTKMGEIITTTKMEYKNFVFEDIPDSIFGIPEGKIIKSAP